MFATVVIETLNGSWLAEPGAGQFHKGLEPEVQTYECLLNVLEQVWLVDKTLPRPPFNPTPTYTHTHNKGRMHSTTQKSRVHSHPTSVDHLPTTLK
jgi:hypothetical protein